MGKFRFFKMLAAVLVIAVMAWGQTIDWSAPSITIMTEAQLRELERRVNGDGFTASTFQNQTITLSYDIVLTSAWTTPIGNWASQFEGIFDGTNKIISGVYINILGQRQGLFGEIGSNGVVRNLGVVGDIIGGESTGGLAGHNYGTIENCFVSGSVTATGNHSNHSGGLVGYNIGTIRNSYVTANLVGTNITGGLVGTNIGTIENSYVTGNVEGNTLVGGLVGTNGGTISNSYTTGNISGTGNYVGGLVGGNTQQGIIRNSYATGNINGGAYIGGLAGSCDGRIENSYATGSINGTSTFGGLVGLGQGAIIRSFYNSETSGQSDNNGRGVPLTTAQMRLRGNFTDWNFNNIWEINPHINNGFPYLRTLSGSYTPTAHAWNWIQTTAPTCTENGVETRTCSICGATDGTRTVDKLPHTFGNWIATTPAGHERRECSRNGCNYAETRINWSANNIAITSAADLRELATRTNNAERNGFAGVTFTLTNDIDLEGNLSNQWVPIGRMWHNGQAVTGRSFGGTFDGNGFVIKGVYFNNPSRHVGEYVGLFGYVVNGTIRNLGVEANITGYQNVGGLVGGCAIDGSIENCFVIGNVTGTSYMIGGIAGNSAGTITNSYFIGNVSGSWSVGGLVGQAGNSITNSYSIGDVSGTGTQIGGLTGAGIGNIVNSFFIGNVSGTTRVGGLVGLTDHVHNITNSYSIGNVSGTSIVGGLAGGLLTATNAIAITNSYASGIVTGITENTLAGLTGNGSTFTNSRMKTAEEMKHIATFSTWNFDDVWGINTNINNGFPYLQALVHNWNSEWSKWSVATAATCAENGVRTRTRVCTIHGEITQTEVIVALEHDMPNEWAVRNHPTCINGGDSIKVCARANCNHEITKTGEINANAHDMPSEWETTISATCATNGIEKRECNLCSAYEVRLSQKAPCGDENCNICSNGVITGLENQVTSLTTENSELQGLVSQLETESTTLRAENTTFSADNLALTTERSVLQSQISTLTTERATLQTTNTALTETISDLQDEIDDLMKRLANCDSPSELRNRQNSNTRYGILLENAIVSDSAKISIITPEQATANVVIMDNLGNVVFTANNVGATALGRQQQTPIIWNLTNQSGRFVVNGTYLIIVEATGISGRRYLYSSRIGVNR